MGRKPERLAPMNKVLPKVKHIIPPKHMDLQKSIQKPPSKISLLQKVTNFLIGFFGGVLLFTFCLRILPSMWGAFLGMGVNIIASIYLLKIFGRDKAKRIAIFGVMASIVAVLVIYMLLAALIFSMFSEIAG